MSERKKLRYQIKPVSILDFKTHTAAQSVIHATETGGVLFQVSKTDHIAAAVHLIRQAYERVSE